MIEFKRNNKVTAVGEPIWKILWNYICWVLGGKPDGFVVKGKK